MSEKCKWDPNKHEGEECPTHGGNSSVNKSKEVKDSYDRGENVDKIHKALENRLGKDFMDKYSDMNAVPDSVWEEIYDELNPGFDDTWDEEFEDDEYNREMQKAQEENAMMQDDELSLENAIKGADDDVLDEQFGKDTPERKLVGAMKTQAAKETWPPQDLKQYVKKIDNGYAFDTNMFKDKSLDEVMMLANHPDFKENTVVHNAVMKAIYQKLKEQPDIIREGSPRDEFNKAQAIRDKELDQAMLNSRPRMGLYDSREVPQGSSYIETSGRFIAPDNGSKMTHDDINKAMNMDLYNDKQLIALNSGIFGSRIASIDIPEGKQVTDAEWNSIKTFIVKAKAEGKTIDFGHGPYNTKDYDTEDILAMIKRKHK